jgi:hypothetical protein
MAQQSNRRDEKDTIKTGRDIPGGDGGVSDEDVKAISDATSKRHRKGGQDHSLENYEDSEPTGGVGAIQDSSLIKENVAHIADDEE